MTIEEIKAELDKKISELEAVPYSCFNYSMCHNGMIIAYKDALRLLNDWNGK